MVDKLKKYKEKIQAHRKSSPKLHEEAAAAASEHHEGGRIIKNKRFELKPMSPDEASMQMELLDKPFFVFMNDKSSEINVIYRRQDGNFGLIEPSK